jgi:glyoxylase-like metal-dependent hydrolase (beta-lactamase superfamily II)
MTDTLTTLPGLDATAPEPLPFAPDLHMRAFALRRTRGDVLVYAAPGMRELGGVSRWYLNHRHEAMFAGDGVDAPLFVHAGDRPGVDLHVRGTFSRRHMLDEDLEVIPTPGHTPGATAFLWDSGEHRYLFTGDTIYLAGGEWIAAVLDSSDRDAYLESLELIRGLDFDVLVPWAASAGEPFHAVATAAETRRRVDAIIGRVRRGASR